MEQEILWTESNVFFVIVYLYWKSMIAKVEVFDGCMCSNYRVEIGAVGI